MPAFYKEWFYKGVLAIKKGIVMAPQPRPTVFAGQDSTLQLCRLIGQFDLKNLLVVTDKPLLDLGILNGAIAELGSRGVKTTIFDGVKPDPTVGVVTSGLTILRESGCDGVLAFGSPLRPPTTFRSRTVWA